jgi:hypothetical protein
MADELETIANTAATLSNDAALIEKKMEVLTRKDYDEGELGELIDEHHGLMEQIAATPARDTRDLVAKAKRALAYRDRSDHEHADADVAVAFSIARDLVALHRAFSG